MTPSGLMIMRRQGGGSSPRPQIWGAYSWRKPMAMPQRDNAIEEIKRLSPVEELKG
jgi:hypothetical protein